MSVASTILHSSHRAYDEASEHAVKTTDYWPNNRDTVMKVFKFHDGSSLEFTVNRAYGVNACQVERMLAFDANGNFLGQR